MQHRRRGQQDTEEPEQQPGSSQRPAAATGAAAAEEPQSAVAGRPAAPHGRRGAPCGQRFRTGPAAAVPASAAGAALLAEEWPFGCCTGAAVQVHGLAVRTRR